MSDFKIYFSSDVKRNFLVVEIHYQGQRLCEINKERGNDQMEIEFVTDLYVLPESVAMLFPLADFLAIVEEARAALREC